MPHIHCCEVNISNKRCSAPKWVRIIRRDKSSNVRNFAMELYIFEGLFHAGQHAFVARSFLLVLNVHVELQASCTAAVRRELGSKRCNGSLLAPSSYYGRDMQ